MEWDPFSIPLLTEVSGTVKFEDTIVGATISEQTDAVTGLTQRVAIESKDPSLQPILHQWALDQGLPVTSSQCGACEKFYPPNEPAGG